MKLVNRIYKNFFEIISFYYVVFWLDFENVFMVILVFILIVKVFKIFKFNVYILSLVVSMVCCWIKIIFYLVVFMVVFLVFM